MQRHIRLLASGLLALGLALPATAEAKQFVRPQLSQQHFATHLLAAQNTTLLKAQSLARRYLRRR
jgi:hypothetical protein